MWLFTLWTHLPDFLYLLLISEQIFYSMGFPGGSDHKESAYNVGDLGLIPGSDPWVGKIPLEREMATHFSILAWKIPWMILKLFL